MSNGVCMTKIGRAVSNSGPLIHLNEVKSIKVLTVVKEILIPEEVYRETRIRIGKNIRLRQLSSEAKNYAKLIYERYFLDLGEAQALALAKQEGINLFFTDDSDARLVAKYLGLDVHGTVGIILRAYKENIISKKNAKEVIVDLGKISSLYITSDLINYVLKKLDSSRLV